MTSFFLIALGVLIVVPMAVIGVVYILVPFFTAIGWTIRHIARFIGGEIGDLLRIVGTTVTGIVLGIMVILNIIIGRWSASAHFGRAVQAEMMAFGAAVYRVLIGHPARFLLLHSLTEGLERRLPAAVAAAPTADKPARLGGGALPGGAKGGRSGQFEGYTIIGSLPGGGSGGKLYIAEADEIKQATFARAGHGDIRQVVIKTFSLQDGSSLPQIVRESRALDAAKRLGLVLDHELGDERFFYVMRYVPGDSLALVTQRLHATSDQSDGEGLDKRNLTKALGYASDLLSTLDVYHRGGLWHKDVKPDNIIVDHQSAHLVDFGLVTPLRSAMTLTTHGTEYFRDPELVRMALKGVKVHQVDGAKFDVYAAGAVLFSMIENSFPAHGGLSQISRRCPEALRWIVRRAMTDYDKRYTSAAAMMADLAVVRNASDPFALRPADLPSVRAAGAEDELDDVAMPIRPAAQVVGVGAGSDEPRIAPVMGVPGFGPAAAGAPAAAAAAMAVPIAAQGRGDRSPPRIRVHNWWSGGYVVDHAETPGAVVGIAATPRGRAAVAPGSPRKHGVPAHEQLRSARARAEQARQRAMGRMSQRRGKGQKEYSTFNAGVAASVLVFVAISLVFAAFMVLVGWNSTQVRVSGPSSEMPLLYADGTLPDVTISAATPAGGTVNVQIGRPNQPTPQVRVQGAAAPLPVPPAPRAVVSSAAPVDWNAAQGQRILVVNELQPAPAPVLSALERMSAAGFILMGNYPGNTADDLVLQEQLILEAEVKLERGLGLLDSPDVAMGLSEWIASTEDVDLLVWFGRAGEKTGPTRFWVFRAADPGEEHVQDKRALELVSRLLGGQ
jgi:hypothetical protein